MVSLPLNSLRRQSAKVPRRRVEHPREKDTGGSRDTHGTGTGHTGAHGHTDHTDEPHNHPTPTTHPHDLARDGRNRGRLNSRSAQARSRPLPAADSEEAAPREPDPASTCSQRPELSAPARRASAPRSWGNDARSAERGDERRGRPSDARSAERGGAFLAPRCRPWLRVRRRRQASATDAGLTSSSSVDLPLHLPQSPPTLSLLDAGRSRADFLFVVRVALIGLLIGRDRPSTSHLLLIQGHVGQPPMTCRL